MKRAIYNLGNEEFTFFVNKIEEELNHRGIPHIFVGGVAVQAHILKRLTQDYETDISTLASNEKIRFQDYIRSTDDIDLALKFPSEGDKDKDIIESVDSIKDLCSSLTGGYISGTENYIFEYGLERGGISRPVFTVSVDGNNQERIYLNISRRSKSLKKLPYSFYNKFIDNGSELVIPYSEGYNLKVTVPKLEHVLATKISQFRAKDSMDLTNLMGVVRDCGEEIDGNELRRILLPVHVDNLGRFNSLTGENIDLSYKPTNH